MPPLKDFDRFAHEGVRDHLKRVRSRFASDPKLSFGSSGDGELTISAADRSAYVRKYKTKDQWCVVFRSDGRRSPAEILDTEDAVLVRLSQHFR